MEIFEFDLPPDLYQVYLKKRRLLDLEIQHRASTVQKTNITNTYTQFVKVTINEYYFEKIRIDLQRRKIFFWMNKMNGKAIEEFLSTVSFKTDTSITFLTYRRKRG